MRSYQYVIPSATVGTGRNGAMLSAASLSGPREVYNPPPRRSGKHFFIITLARAAMESGSLAFQSFQGQLTLCSLQRCIPAGISAPCVPTSRLGPREDENAPRSLPRIAHDRKPKVTAAVFLISALSLCGCLSTLPLTTGTHKRLDFKPFPSPRPHCPDSEMTVSINCQRGNRAKNEDSL